MTARTVAAVLLAVCTTLPLAHAEDAQKGVRVGADYAATIAAEAERFGYGMAAACGYVAVLTPNNRYQTVYGGMAQSYGSQVPQVIYIKCSVDDGRGTTDEVELAYSPATTQVVDSTGAWRFRPEHVCVEGFAVFGPTPVIVITLERICETDLTR